MMSGNGEAWIALCAFAFAFGVLFIGDTWSTNQEMIFRRQGEVQLWDKGKVIIVGNTTYVFSDATDESVLITIHLEPSSSVNRMFVSYLDKFYIGSDLYVLVDYSFDWMEVVKLDS